MKIELGIKMGKVDHKIKIIFQILICTICCLNVTISSSFAHINTSNLYIDDINTITDFTRFSFDEEKPYLNIDVTSSSVLIDHTESYATDSRMKFKMEFNIGKASFGNFDVTINTTYDLTKVPFWGELITTIGSNYQSGYIISNDIKLGYVQIKDPWGGVDGVFGAGKGIIINNADIETVMPNPITHNNATFHLKRTGSSVTCEILQNSISKVSYSWIEEEVLACNYIRIELLYWSEVDEFSFTLYDLNAVLDVDGEIIETPVTTPPPPESSIQLPSIDYIGVLIILGIITGISIICRRKKIPN